MLTLALALSLSATPGARLVGDHAHPIGEGILLAQADQPPPLPPAEGVAPPQTETLQELRYRYAELERSRPRLGGWIAMMSVGTPICALFTYLTVIQLIYGSSIFGPALIILTGVIAGIGFAAMVVGTIMLIVMAVRGGRISGEMDELRQRIDMMERSAPPAPPPGYYPPPPPPPPPAVERETVRPLITLAAF